jgi:uncharacterized membrane protein
MNEALFDVILFTDRWETAAEPHVLFLAIFSCLMIGFGWLSYWKMVQVERRL